MKGGGTGGMPGGIGGMPAGNPGPGGSAVGSKLAAERRGNFGAGSSSEILKA